MADTYDVGDKAHVTGEFTDPLNDNAYVDPTAVFLSVKDPSANVVTYTYSVSGITKDATGQYSADIDIDEAGRWYYRWYSTGTGQAAEWKSFLAEANPVV